MTYILLPNYPDPFGTTDDGPIVTSGTNEAKTESTSPISGKSSKTFLKSRIDFIQYKGLITNIKTHKVVAIISIHGRDEMVNRDRDLENISIVIKKGGILISYLGEKYWIRKL